jgi:hypothetical protein
LKLPPLAIPWALEILKERLRAFKDGSIDENCQVIKRKGFVTEMIARGYLPKNRSYDTNERYLRLAISRIRTTDGEWILSTGGYTVATGWLTMHKKPKRISTPKCSPVLRSS